MCIHSRAMKSLVFLVFATLLGISHSTYPLWTHTHPGTYGYTYEVPCNNVITNEIVLNFRQALYGTITVLFRKTVALSDGHFTFSPYTIWKALAAIAEGSEGQTREELYRFLNLPEDKCIRQMYYQLASTREAFSHDVVLDRNRLFIADSGVILNRSWENYVKAHRLIDVVQAPYKSNHVAEIESWKQTFDAHLPSLNLNGNSLILESLDYNGLWTAAFSDFTIVQEPFYNALGDPVASLEYMKMRKRVHLAYIPSLNMKILELPVGKGARYKMLFGLVMGNTPFRSTLDIIESSIIYEALSKFKRTQVPIEVVIPRLTMTSEIDVRTMLEAVGVTGMWSDPYATR